MIGCCQVKQRNNEGKLLFQQVENSILFNFEQERSKWEPKQLAGDLDKARKVKSQYSKLKHIQDLEKELHVPNKHEEVIFYSRFESGNLHRVVKKNQISEAFMNYELINEQNDIENQSMKEGRTEESKSAAPQSPAQDPPASE